MLLLVAAAAVSASLAGAPEAVAMPNCGAPTISGTERDGSTLTGVAGTCSPTVGLDREFEWFRCTDPAGAPASCVSVSGTTASPANYVLGPDDAGRYLKLEQRATDLLPGEDVDFDITGQIADQPPANTAPPTIPSGAPTAGQPVTMTDDGSWTGTPPLAFTYRWVRCSGATAATCTTDIPNATGTSYTPLAADVGFRLALRVTATNDGGSDSELSNLTGVVIADPPENTGAAPSVSPAADLMDGQELSAHPGGWSNPAPTSFAYRWQRCDAAGTPASCTDIADATSAAYTLGPDDVGATVRVVVSAVGPYGTGTAPSAATSVVAPAPPVNVDPPQALGSAVRGEFLSASHGFWEGTPPLSFDYTWQRCGTEDPASCSDVAGETGPTYLLREADVGSRLRVLVTADNAAPGVSDPVPSALTEVVKDVAKDPPAGGSGPRLLRPFPVVAMGGELLPDGATLSLFRVRGERGALVRVRCFGRGCPVKGFRRRIGRRRQARLRPLERFLPAGTVIVIRVSKRRTIGKFTRIRIRGGKRKPTRIDRCLRPGATRPSRCP